MRTLLLAAMLLARACAGTCGDWTPPSEARQQLKDAASSRASELECSLTLPDPLAGVAGEVPLECCLEDIAGAGDCDQVIAAVAHCGELAR